MLHYSNRQTNTRAKSNKKTYFSTFDKVTRESYQNSTIQDKHTKKELEQNIRSTIERLANLAQHQETASATSSGSPTSPGNQTSSGCRAGVGRSIRELCIQMRWLRSRDRERASRKEERGRDRSRVLLRSGGGYIGTVAWWCDDPVDPDFSRSTFACL